MRIFISKIVVFISPLIIISFGLLMISKNNHQFEPSNMYYYKEFKQAFDGSENNIVVIGNSKILSAIDKKTLTEKNKHTVANLGFSSANMSISKLTLESYLNYCTLKPKLVLLEVSWFSFNIDRTHLHNIVGDLFINDPKLWKNYFNYDNNIITPKIVKAFKKSLKRFVGFQKTHNEITYDSRFVISSPETVDYTFNITDFEFYFPNYVAGIDTRLLKDFYSIVNMCKKENIDLILFTAPEDETYSKLQKDKQKIKSVFHEVSETNPNVYYLDYTLGGDLYDKNYEKWLRNSHHINENNLFSKELLKDIKTQIGNL